MIMFNIAEWIANVLVLSLGLFFWMLAIAVGYLIIDEITRKIRREYE